MEQQWSVVHIVASSLLRNPVGSNPDGRIAVMDAGDGETNQGRIVSAYHQLITSLQCDWIILDGHYVVPTMESLFPVKVQTFLELDVDRYAVLVCDPQCAFERLASRRDVPRWGGSVDRLQAYQEAEVKHAEDIAAATGRPLTIIRDSDHASEDFAAALGWRVCQS
jgi:adenylate kinase